MFHILVENSTPDRLVGGPWTSISGSHSSDLASMVECGLKGGQIREAIPQQRFRNFLNNGKLNRGRVCKRCFQKVGGKYSGKRENTEIVEATTDTE